ncbi:MAG: hypothetical protein AAGJ79_11775 [Verrucomicrobiota bacterium]
MSDSTRATRFRQFTAPFRCLGKSPLATLFVVSFVLTRPLVPSGIVNGDLDPSWNGVLLYAAEKGWDFGDDIIYTYGPLGYLVSTFFQEETFGSRTAFSIFLHAIGAVLLVLAVRPQPILWKVIAAAGLLATPLSADILLPVYLASGFIVALRSKTMALRMGFVVLASIFALLKFTLFVASVIAIGALTVEQCQRKHWRFVFPASLLLSLTSILLVWIGIAKQPLRHFVSWLAGSWDVASNFNKTMHLQNPEELMGAAFAMLGLAGLTAILHLRESDRPTWPRLGWKNGLRWLTSAPVVAAGVFSFFVFVAWKHGFTRSDGHVTIFFLGAPTLIAVFAGSFLTSRIAMTLLLAAIGLGQVSRLASYEHFTGEPFRLEPPFAVSQWQASHNLRSLHRLDAVKGDIEAEWKSMRSELALPAIREAVGRDTIDFLSDRQGFALANNLRLKSRPMFQAFSAYSSTLCARNALFFASKEAPDWVAVDLAAIDGKFPFSTDGPALIQVLQRYQLVLFEPPFLLYQHRGTPVDVEFFDLPESEAMIGETIIAPTVPDGKCLWAEIEIDPTLGGTVAGLLTQPSTVELRIEDARHPLGTKSYRLPAPLAASGILLQPFLRDTADVAMLGSGREMNSIQRFSIHAGSGFHARIRIRFRTFDLIRQAPPDENRLWSSALGIMPIGTESSIPPRWQEMKGEIGLCLQAPGHIQLSVPPGSKRLRGRFGVDRDAYRDIDGANGTITFLARAEGEVLWRDTINPMQKKSDRAWQSFDFRFDSGSVIVELVVQGDEDWQQGLWTGLEFLQD